MAQSVPNPDMLQFLELVKVMLLTAQPGSSVPLPSFKSKLTCIKATDNNNRSLWVAKLNNHDLSIGLATADIPEFLPAKDSNSSQLVNIEGSLTTPREEPEESIEDHEETGQKTENLLQSSESQRFTISALFAGLRRLIGCLLILAIIVFILYLAYEGLDPYTNSEIFTDLNVTFLDNGDTCAPSAESSDSLCRRFFLLKDPNCSSS